MIDGPRSGWAERGAHLVVVAIEPASAGAGVAGWQRRLVEIAELHLRARPPAVVSAADGRVFVVAALGGREGRDVLRTAIERCLAHGSRALELELRAGIGRSVSAVGQLEAARETAEDCLAGERREPIVCFEEIHGRALLGDVARVVASWRGGASAVSRTLRDVDAAGRTEYARTLLSVLEAFGNTDKAAARLHVHTNTVRYRMRRILELTEIDLEDGDQRLALELELRVGLAS